MYSRVIMLLTSSILRSSGSSLSEIYFLIVSLKVRIKSVFGTITVSAGGEYDTVGDSSS